MACSGQVSRHAPQAVQSLVITYPTSTPAA